MACSCRGSDPARHLSESDRARSRRQNFRIQKLSPTGQVLAVFGDAGQRAGQFWYADGLAVDRAGHLWVADAGNNRIQEFSSRGDSLAVLGQFGSQPGEFNNPSDVAVDRAGNVYVVDQGNHRIEKLSPQGTPLATWGSRHPRAGGLKLRTPMGIAVSPAGMIYVSDFDLSRVVKLSRQGKVLAVWDTKDTFGRNFYPWHITLDSAGHLFVTDAGHSPRVVELSSAGKILRSWMLGPKAAPSGVAVTPSGRLFVSDNNSYLVYQYRLSSPQILSTWGHDVRAMGEFFFPTAVALGPAGTLDVADEGNARIEQVSTTTTTLNPRVSWNLPTITAQRIKYPVSVAADSLGNVYVVGDKKNSLARLRPNGAFVPGWPASRTLPSNPIGVAVSPSGDIDVADGTTSQIWRFNATGRLLGRWGKGPGTASGQFLFAQHGPVGIAFDHQRHVYITDTLNDRIEKFTTSGRFLAAWRGFGGFPGSFSSPQGVAVDGQGNVYVADTGNAMIEELSPTGALLAQWGTEGSAVGQFRDPSGIAVDGTGRIYVADSNNDRIQVYTPLSGATAPATVRVSGPSSVSTST
jgi:tripartite motif-containing protein 71